MENCKFTNPAIFDELVPDFQEAHAMISAKGERIPFLSPLRTKESKGCVEKWMMQAKTFSTSNFVGSNPRQYFLLFLGAKVFLENPCYDTIFA
jgi:hypothetical protein